MDFCPHCNKEGLDRSLGLCTTCKKSVLKDHQLRELRRILVFEPKPPRDGNAQFLAELIEGGTEAPGKKAIGPAIVITVIVLIALRYIFGLYSFWIAFGVFVACWIGVIFVFALLAEKFRFDFETDLEHTIANYERRHWAAHNVDTLGEKGQETSFECYNCHTKVNLTSKSCEKCFTGVGHGISLTSLDNPKPPKKKFPFFRVAFGSLAAIAALVLVVGISTKPDNAELGAELKRITMLSLQADQINQADDFGTALLKFGCALDLDSCASGFVRSMVIEEDHNLLVARAVGIRLQDIRIGCLGALGSWRCDFNG